MRPVISKIAELLADVSGRVLVVGCTRRSGLSTANFLASRGFSVTANDLKKIDELTGVGDLLDAGVKREFGHQKLSLLDNIELIVLSPGVPRAIPLIREADNRGIPVIAEVELAWHFMKGYMIGITGTDGKSTTTAMCAYILRKLGLDAREGGNIGIPLISLADSSTDDSVTVVELSSFQLETIHDFNCDCAAFINLSPDHLDRYDSMDDYLSAKLRLFGNQCSDDYCIVNSDDPAVWGALKDHRAKIRRFSMYDDSADMFYRDGQVFRREGNSAVPFLNSDEMTIKGLHNIQNAMTASLLVISLFEKQGRRCDLNALGAACAAFEGLSHRLQYAGESGGIRYINDSKATTVNAVRTALKSVRENSVFIIGGRSKGEDYSLLADAVSENRFVKGVVLIGETAPEFEPLFTGRDIDVLRASDMEDAVRKGGVLCGKGSVVLSPGCASFDMFENYEKRGESFLEAISRIIGAL